MAIKNIKSYLQTFLEMAMAFGHLNGIWQRIIGIDILQNHYEESADVKPTVI